MTFQHPFIRAALWLACSAATAAHAAPQGAPAVAAGPARADAAVPPTTYRPLLPYRPDAPARTTPDQNWQALNRTVAGYTSMSLTMGGMDGPAQQAGGADDAAPAHAAPPAAEAHAAPEASMPRHHHHGAAQ